MRSWGFGGDDLRFSLLSHSLPFPFSDVTGPHWANAKLVLWWVSGRECWDGAAVQTNLSLLATLRVDLTPNQTSECELPSGSSEHSSVGAAGPPPGGFPGSDKGQADVARPAESGTPHPDVTTPRRAAGTPRPPAPAGARTGRREPRGCGPRRGRAESRGGGACCVGADGGGVGSARSASGRSLQPPPSPPPPAALSPPLLRSSGRGSAAGARTSRATRAGGVSAAPRPAGNSPRPGGLPHPEQNTM